MKTIHYKKKFKKDLKKIQKTDKFKKDIFENILDLLLKDKPLHKKQKEHQLKGNYSGLTECHLQNDILLVYTNTLKKLTFFRIGTHSDIF